MNNKNYLKEFSENINNADIKLLLFKNDFTFEMSKASVKTLQSINQLISEYQNNVFDPAEDQKILNLFGILQGLFVGIDCVYTIGRTLSINKLMINLNQNIVLREIKHIRNDVVGHPSYRFYEDDVVGFCSLDLETVSNANFKYFIYLPKNGKVEISSKEINLMDIIGNYFKEITNIFTQTNILLQSVKEKKNLEFSNLISLLSFKYAKGVYDFALLDKIYANYDSFFNINQNNNRVLWRLNLIKYLYNYKDKNAYVEYLTYREMYKTYALVYSFEKRINPKLNYHFVKLIQNQEFKLLKIYINKIKKADFNKNILHDYLHPLYIYNMTIVFDFVKDKGDVKSLINWIKEMIDKKEQNMLYLIGSELKK